MENDLYNEINQYQKLGNKKDIPKNLIFKHYINNAKENIKLEDFDIASISTHKNSADSLNSLNAIPEKEIPFSSRLPIKNVKDKLNNIYAEEPKKRKDNFGREIKKGGKHKIAFVDDLDIIKSITPENVHQYISKKSGKLVNLSSTKNIIASLPIIKEIKRSNSCKNDRAIMMKNIYNILKTKTKSKKKFKESFIHFIDVENLKGETKLNTYSIQNRMILSEEENVCCSCYCSIW